MASSSLLALIDDIASLLDDVAVMTKVAGQKTAGVLGDDLALNAEQVIGAASERELPIVYSVFKGSLINKMILVPSALVISAFASWLIIPLLMCGGLFLSYEGFEKVFEKIFHKKEKKSVPDILEFNETEKIKGAIRTDFILSAEIIAITLGVVQNTAVPQQALVLSLVAVAMTVFVYGFVAGIVKIDDLGLYLIKNKPNLKKMGYFLLSAAPYLMKLLGVLGTAAMFLVGGGILVHGIPFLHHSSGNLLFEGVVGVFAGALVFMMILGVQKIWPK